MARNPLLDPLRGSNFWLYDVAPIDFAPALPIFTPLSGFSSITAPQITIETQQINEGNWAFTKTAVKGASVGAITLSRGVSWFNSDFWRWIMSAVEGSTGSTFSTGGIGLDIGRSFSTGRTALPIGGITYRRTLLLVHFFRNTPASSVADQIALAVGSASALSLTTGFAVGAGAGVATGLAAGVASGLQLGSQTAAGTFSAGFAPPSSGSNAMGIKIPARAFLLKNCIPTRYKTGTDYDASSGQVSIQELDVQPETVEEISLAA